MSFSTYPLTPAAIARSNITRSECIVTITARVQQLVVDEATGDFDPIELGHAHVEHGNVRRQSTDFFERRGAIAQRCNDGHGRVGADYVLQDQTKLRMIVCDQNADLARWTRLVCVIHLVRFEQG